MKEGLDLPGVAPETKPRPGVGIPRRRGPAPSEEGCSYRADEQQNRPPLRKGAKVSVQGDAVRPVVLDIFRIRDSLANLMRTTDHSSFQINSQTHPQTCSYPKAQSSCEAHP